MGASALERWIEYIEDQLNAAEIDFRLEATLAAGNLGSELLVEPIGELLADDDPEIVLAAIVALGEIGGDEAVELLQAFRPQAPEGLEEAVDGAIELASGGGFRRFGELAGAVDVDEDDEE
jgi:HEAT repeat protein